MNIFSKLNKFYFVIIFLCISLANINILGGMGGAAAPGGAAADESADIVLPEMHFDSKELEEAVRNLDDHYVNIHDVTIDQLKNNENNLRQEFINFQNALKTAIPMMSMPNNSDLDQIHKRFVQRILGQLTSIPVYAQLEKLLASCQSSQFAGTPAELMQKNGIRLSHLIAGINIEIRKDLRNNILWIAAARNCKELVELLLLLGANPNYRIPANIPAHLKGDSGKSVICKILELQKANPIYDDILGLFKKYGFALQCQQAEALGGAAAAQ